MPVVQVSMKAGRTREQKRVLVSRITQALVEVCGANPDRIHVVIHDVDEDNWGACGPSSVRRAVACHITGRGVGSWLEGFRASGSS